MDLLVNYELDHLLERCVMKPAVRFPPIMTLAARFPISNCIMKLSLQSLFNSLSRERCMRFFPSPLAAQQDETGIPIIHLKLAKGHK